MIGAMPPRVKMRWRRSRRRGSENKLPGSRHLHFRQTFPVAAAITFGFAALFFLFRAVSGVSALPYDDWAAV